MFLDDPSKLSEIVAKSDFTIVAHPPSFDLETIAVENVAYSINPDEKNTIRLEALAPLKELARTKNVAPLVILIYSAETMTESAMNSLLKTLEQPTANLSFVFFTSNPNALLPTILSRAHLYYLGTNEIPAPNEKNLVLARELVSGDPRTLLRLSTTLAKDREKALEVVSTAINSLTTAQLTSPSPLYLSRLKKLLTLHENLSRNGHIRLHVVADMM